MCMSGIFSEPPPSTDSEGFLVTSLQPGSNESVQLKLTAAIKYWSTPARSAAVWELHTIRSMSAQSWCLCKACCCYVHDQTNAAAYVCVYGTVPCININNECSSKAAVLHSAGNHTELQGHKYKQAIVLVHYHKYTHGWTHADTTCVIIGNEIKK